MTQGFPELPVARSIFVTNPSRSMVHFVPAPGRGEGVPGQKFREQPHVPDG
jgi:hypothetical protein